MLGMETVTEVSEGTRRKLVALERVYGETIREYRGAEGVTDIHRNEDGRIWIERAGQEIDTGVVLPEPDSRRIIQLVADIDGQRIKDGIVDANLPTGERFGALIPTRGPSSFSIRQPFGKVISLADYEESGILSNPFASAIRQAVAEGLNILVIGATGSGKSTLTNAILSEPPYPTRRSFIIEDQKELQFQGANVVHAKIGEATDQALVRHSLRRKPISIIYGELRDRIALDFIKAVRSGHKGLTTIHAEDGIGGLDRLEFLLVEAGLDPMVARQYVLQAIDFVVVIRELQDAGRKYRRVVEVGRVKRELDAKGRYQIIPVSEKIDTAAQQP